MRRCLRVLIIGALLMFTLTRPAGAAEKKYAILAIQHQEFGPFTESYQGFVQGLKDLGYGEKVSIAQFNARGNLKALDEKVQAISKSRDLDLVFSIGTHSTKRVVDKVKHIPIVFTDLGDPEHAGVVSNWKSSGANYTGVETPGYVSLGIKLIYELVNFKSIGMIYLAGSPSHEASIRQVKKLCEDLGVEFAYEGFPLRDKAGKGYPEEVVRTHIRESLDRVLSKVEVFYVQISKTFEKHFDIFHEAFVKYRTPSAGDPIYIKKGAIMGIGRDKIEFGRQCAQYAVKIFEGTNPSDLPMDVGVKFTIAVNLKAAVLVGYDPPVDLLGAADNIYQELEGEKR
jgi:putative ABC transport system substrate-binding protein